MEGYLGQTVVQVEDTPFAFHTPQDWAMYFIKKYGQIDGDWHKAWVLDQVARILKGTPVIINLASWEDGTSEFRVDTGEPSQEYLDWVISMKGEDGTEYSYDEGVAP